MRIINKQISLESFTSRLPGVTPAYVPGSTTPIFFDEESLKNREYMYPSNYGLIPMFVDTTLGCLSWETISDWYHFFTDYYHLLKDWGHCGVKYETAVEYYNNESKNGYADQLKYGASEQTYIDLDATFDARGGSAMYTFLCTKVVPSFEIPSKYTDYWHCTKLFYPDFIKWKGWFKSRYQKYSSYNESSQCSAADDCCDCTEYFDRGGNDMYALLTGATFEIPTSAEKFCTPKFSTEVSIQVSIDDLGEFSIFSDEYVLGKDYRTAKNYGDTENTHSGTVVSVDGKAMMLTSGAGFKFDSKYMENYYDESGWTEHYGNAEINGIPEEVDDIRFFFDNHSYYYAFNSDMERVTGDTPDEIRTSDKMLKTYELTPLDAVIINGVEYNVITEEYGTYNGKTYCVYREVYTDTPYSYIDGKRVYADAKLKSSSEYFYFPHFNKWYPRTRNGGTKNFIMYAGTLYEVGDSNSITINGTSYTRVIGKFDCKDGQFYVGKDNKVYEVNFYGELGENSNYSASTGTVTEKKNEDIDIYESGLVAGSGISRLTELRTNSMLVDDTGDPIEGRYNISGKTNHQPAEGEVLDLLYEKYNIGRMYPIDDTDLYYGDMILDMDFFYRTYDDEHEFHADTWSGSSLETIQSITIPDDYTDEVDSGTVYCNVQYVIGGTFSGETKTKRVTSSPVPLNIGTVYSLAGNGCSSGVTYTEEVKFIRKEAQYKLETGVDGQIPTTINAASSHTTCYPITYYQLEQNLEKIESDYGGEYVYPVADFEMKLPPSSGWTEYENGVEVFPVFRQEYLLGSATMQNLDVDIYIDRGTNAAFEKHLKLGEITSMEALENYTNGYFKMEQ